jgi:hypothetical protein
VTRCVSPMITHPCRRLIGTSRFHVACNLKSTECPAWVPVSLCACGRPKVQYFPSPELQPGHTVMTIIMAFTPWHCIMLLPRHRNMQSGWTFPPTALIIRCSTRFHRNALKSCGHERMHSDRQRRIFISRSLVVVHGYMLNNRQEVLFTL